MFYGLCSLADKVHGPWLLMGDCNVVMNLEERVAQPVRLNEVRPMRESMDYCSVTDIKASGNYFTWNNKQGDGRRVFCVK